MKRIFRFIGLYYDEVLKDILKFTCCILLGFLGSIVALALPTYITITTMGHSFKAPFIFMLLLLGECLMILPIIAKWDSIRDLWKESGK